MSFFGCCLFISAHFKILREIINDIELSEFVRHHQEIFDLASNFKEVFKPVIFVHYLLNIVLLCVTALESVIIEDLGKKIIAVSSTFLGVVGLFVFCYGGQIVFNTSESICDDLNIFTKDYIIVLIRSQKPVKLKVAFFDPTLLTCRFYLDHTLSLIAVLKHVVKS